ncbi:unnamed protein product [Rotaria magnacalcarata]|uniref:histone acetyltransferase n=1 Tax=Rotaria magnacalcarata TaxID=392030 RepID=A0A815S1L4_9BILA|nr:unnamed protein product [Rotaria magnacalcarata]CAF4174743.1 unnamed protein product [Rotaria magnacalcarata]
MHSKLLHGEYENPLQFCDDAWLMFDNVWRYNTKSMKIYKMCQRLAKLFVESINPVLQSLGYCCADRYAYFPKVFVCCRIRQFCEIRCGANYYSYKNPEPSRLNLSNNQYRFCFVCFNSIQSESIFVGDDPTQTLVEIPKNLFLSAINDVLEPEIMVDCIVCKRRWHQVCALHCDQIWPDGFICNTCVREYNLPRKENCHKAENLPATDLSSQLESRVNKFLLDKNCHEGRVTIRVLHSGDKMCHVNPKSKRYFSNQVANDGFPYRTKTIFAFQEIDGAEVAFFGMYVQEYDEHCPAPNTRRVYISIFDTVRFFRPNLYRQDVYHEILIGYLDYVKQRGYMYAHMWACPAIENYDYIFFRHPSEQRLPKVKRLQNWCKKMLDRAMEEHVAIDYKGDFWSTTIEATIKELDQQDEDSDHPIESEVSNKRKCANADEKKNLKRMKTQEELAKSQMPPCTDLKSKIFSTMEKTKEAFFVICLHNPIATSPPAVNDTDVPIECDLMDTRDAFLSFSCDRNLEFSSLRRAKFSTMAFLSEIHASKTENPTYNCNNCRQQCGVHYHCTRCEDFDLCEKCFNIEPKHEHKMECSVPCIVDVNQDDKCNSLNSI